MRLFRSMTVLALCACLSMLVAPVAVVGASLDPGLTVAEKHYPAPFVVDVAQAVIADMPTMTAVPGGSGRLSRQGVAVVPLVPIARPADQSFIDLRMRC